MAFTHLHTHTEYSLLDGSNKIKEYVKRVKELGMTSAAITDHGVMYGVIDFYKEAKNQGIKPIIGCEVYITDGNAKEKLNNRYYHLILLAENNEGYYNLSKLVSYGFVEGYYYKPRIDKEILKKYSKGLIALSACLRGEIPSFVVEDYNSAIKRAKEYIDIFGRDSFFIEIQKHNIDIEKAVNNGLIKLAKELDLGLVITNDVHYTYREDSQSHDILLCIQTNKIVSDTNRMKYVGNSFYVKSEKEMKELFYDLPEIEEAIENTVQIADRCNVDIEFHKLKLPHYNVPDGYTAESYLRNLVKKGLEERYLDNKEYNYAELEKRADEELSIIENMGFVDYFLIVWDFIDFARRHSIAVGPGRGSAAGSIVSYCLHITDIDPIKYSLIFERFLNPERVSMPDIDIDFCYERRQEVIDYVRSKYGDDNVVQIITFGTLGARGVIRDVGRVLNMPYSQVDDIAKLIPMEKDININKALESTTELKLLYDTDSEIKYLIDMAKKLEGLPRHTSIHAAGVVICGKRADELIPLSRGADETVTTQFPMTTVEELGLLKMDFLGLRTLTVIKKAMELANLDYENRNKLFGDYDDKSVYELISSGRAEGVFQLESAGMRSFMQELMPTCLEDIIAGISLYRPGPMDFIPKYIKGMQDKNSITYDTPLLEPILKPTYGCIVYQEQVMQIVRDLAGYSLGRSDLVRRAMSKKKSDIMIKERQNFIYGNEEEDIKGCIGNGISAEIAGKIYDDMLDFAKYAFNKSHAAGYAVVAYETAYLKCHYRVEFMAALLTSVIDNPLKTKGYLQTLKRDGLSLYPPSVNHGGSGYKVKDGSIVYALDAVKNVGKKVAEEIERERMQNGPYTGFDDFIKRLIGKRINKKTVESLILAGAFDEFEINRRSLMMGYADIMDNIACENKDNISGQIGLLDFMSDEDKEKFSYELPNVEDYDSDNKLKLEKEVTGIYISSHPLKEWEKYLENKITNYSTDFMATMGESLDNAAQIDDSDKRVKNGERAVVGGVVINQSIKTTKKNDLMAVIELEDILGTIEVVVFPNVYSKYSTFLKDGAKLLISGKVDAGNESKDGKLLAYEIIPLINMDDDIYILFDNKESYLQQSKELKEYFAYNIGIGDVYVCFSDTKETRRLSQVYASSSSQVLEYLKNRFGEQKVKSFAKKLDKT